MQVKNGQTVLETYGYDPLGRRITENPGTIRDLYYSMLWQLLEEDVNGSMQDQYVWSPVYIDALIERDTPPQRIYVQQDANFNVTTLVDASGNIQERYVYDPYGSVTILAANWTTRGSSNYGWVYFHQGGRYDLATGLYAFHNRDLSPSLGRWVELDPISFGGGDTNLYRDQGGDPITRLDPSGLETPTASGIRPGHDDISIGPGCPKTFQIPSAVSNTIDCLWPESFNPDGTVQEQGGIVVTGSLGGKPQWKPGKPVSGNPQAILFPKPGYFQKPLYTIHTHPYTAAQGGYTGVSFSGADIATLLWQNEGDIKYVGAGTCIFVLQKWGDANKCNCSQEKIKERWNEAFNSAGGTFQERVEQAVIAAIKGCALCYYKSCKPNGGGNIPGTATLVSGPNI